LHRAPQHAHHVTFGENAVDLLAAHHHDGADTSFAENLMAAESLASGDTLIT
jgi:hypothetical protein